MPSSEKVSFVIPSFNSAAWLCHAVKSCQKQNYADIEIVVVDDGSTDSTKEVMDFMSAADSRIKYIRLDKNVGRSEARNIGNKAASGAYICVLDADDISLPDRAKLTAKALSKADFVHGSAEVIDVIGNRIGELRADVFNLDKAIKEGVNRMVHSTCAYRKEIAEKIPYESGEAARLGLDDWMFQLKVALSGAKMDYIPSVISNYRDIESGVSKTRDHNEVVAFKKAFTEALKTTA